MGELILRALSRTTERFIDVVICIKSVIYVQVSGLLCSPRQLGAKSIQRVTSGRDVVFHGAHSAEQQIQHLTLRLNGSPIGPLHARRDHGIQ